ncbi:isoprenylcysteine carboxylmethyltransferase family protein [Microcoleus sp. FACHB-68]|uniref:methyltransferase family protein n=1 Tax=Microcoleus sp. FACHB-68 TaxID=2692826 RepID=UPI001683E0FE|nr:isoprenylcysteine carboxylmethyltransferase family protein [Microcoleus sp. FACHB-68]MBD1936686.1 isoprenylcysteine carboxylmethyltransferase family protein [Microcoleus sp. FACHB-68]
MKLLRDWGFTRQGWRSGERGEYLVLIQGLLLIALVMLPVYRPAGLNINSPALLYGIWGIAAILGVGAFVLIIKGLLDLGGNLTPLPYPKENGQLVQTGIYSLVRHPLYSGLILAALSWAIWQQSLFHLAGGVILFAFLNAKASREEAWLSQKYPDYPNYQNRVKKLIPWLY